jgi:NitT/TauT family transport system substrate-binding protein
MKPGGAVATLCAIAVATIFASRAEADDLLKIAVPQKGAWDAGLAELGKRGGIFKKHGLDIEVLYTQAGPESIQALIAGSVDIATASGASAALATFSRGAPIRIIGNEIIGAPDQYWYVRADSPVHKIQDFNGKTVAYSLNGSSSHANLLALIAQYKLTAKPTSTGSIAATLTQTMTKQVDVGFSAIPFFLARVEAGEIRIVGTGSDVAALKTRTGRVNLTNLNTLQNRRDVLRRFHAAYKETIEWMYSDPAALKPIADYCNLTENLVLKVRGMLPKETMNPDHIVGIDQMMSEAVAGKFLSAPLTADQIKTLVQIDAVTK